MFFLCTDLSQLWIAVSEPSDSVIFWISFDFSCLIIIINITHLLQSNSWEKTNKPCSSSVNLKKLRHTLVHKRITRSKQRPQAPENKISPLLTIAWQQVPAGWHGLLGCHLNGRQTGPLSLHVRSNLSSLLSSHGLPPLHGWGCGLRDALVAVRLQRVFAVLWLGAVLWVRLLPQRPALFILKLQVGAREGVKDGRDGESHEEDAAQDTAERHHLSGNASGHHVSVADCGHGNHSPPVATRDASELLLGAHLAFS